MSKQKCGQSLETASVDSPVGRIDITVCPNGLHRLSSFDHIIDPNLGIKVEIKDKDFVVNNNLINESIEWLSTYFGTNGQHIDHQKSPPFCPFVTQSEFKRKVWSTLQKCTFGQTITYSELALRSVGNQRASRAVGNAMKTNPFLLIVPCHRVVKSDGTIGHFSAPNGTNLKEWLLSFEKKGSKQ